MNLSFRDYQNIARALNLSERVIQRIAGSVIVSVDRALSAEELEKAAEVSPEELKSQEQFNIGLRLGKESSTQTGATHEQVNEVSAALREYHATCTLVFEWLQRGDFNPKKIPERITKALLIHASRTAGRLRARLMRG